MNTQTPRPNALALAPALTAALLAVGCTPSEPAPELDDKMGAADAFFAALTTHCGKAYAGKLVSEDAADADFAGAAMVMHVSECSDERIAVPFHVQLTNEAGTLEWDRSRTWLITRNDEGPEKSGLRLKHDHRHKDGEPDAVTMYGGDSAAEGTPRSRDFPVDDFSIEMFKREGLTASVTNVWTVEVDPAGTEGGQYVYQLKRTVEGGAPEERLFRVEFDLSEEVDVPPAAWGWE